MSRFWALCLHTSIFYIVSAAGGAQLTQRCDYFYGVPSEHLNATDGDGKILRIRGIRDHSGKDFVLGGLFPVHFDNSDGVRCGEVRREGGLERVEAMLFAIDCINSDSHLLQNLTLGYDIRDTCYIESIGLDEALDLIISASQLHKDTCEPTLNSFHDNASEHSSPRLVPTLGLIGAAASRVSLPIASLGRLFEMPQISYSSTSPRLSNRDRYTYFQRTITPDNVEVRALISLLIEFKWNHISIVYSNNAYGTAAKDEIVEIAQEYGICIDKNLGIPDAHPDYKTIADGLNSSSAEVVIVFASQRNALYLLGNYTSITHHRKLTWVASAAWSQAISVISRFNGTLAGMFGAAPTSKHLETFHKYFEQLTIESNLRDPWFPEYFSVLTKCSLNASCNYSANLHNYKQEYSIPRVIDAVYAFANALQDYLDDNCDQPVVWNRASYSCKGQKRALNGSTMLEYLRKVHFDGLTHTSIAFNDQGYISKGSYEILNYKAFTSNYTYQLKMVGIWEDGGASSALQNHLGKLVLYDRDSIQFGLNDDGNVIDQPRNSQCGYCQPGEFVTPAFSSCCGICKPCDGQNFSNHTQATACSKCDEYMWGNRPTQGSSHCVSIEEAFLKLSDPWAIAMEILSLLGLSAVGVVATVFGKYWKTPVIVSSGREQMILLLTGISLSYILAFFFVSPPVLPVCIIQYVGLWFCFSLMFGALMIKIIRVGRIFLQQSNLKTLRFQKPKHQILFTCMVVAGQLLIIILASTVIHHYPQVLRNIRVNSSNSLDFPQVIVFCSRGHLAMVILSLMYETIIIAVTTIFGIISFKYPDNFNEAKHISFCTFALIVIWLAFIPGYFATASMQEVQNAAISFAIIMTASAVLVCMFGPRIFIALFRPERNKKKFSRMRHNSQHHNNLSTSPSFLTLNDRVLSENSDPYEEASADTPASDYNHMDK